MEGVQLIRVGGAAEMAERAAGQWLEETARISERPVSWALSGGRISGTFFSEIGKRVFDQKLPASHAHIFWADERCVPPESPDSNFLTAREKLIQPLGIAENHVHRIKGELAPDQAALEAENDLRSYFDAHSDSGAQLDLVFLGMGEDGHTASLFPEEPATMVNSPELFRAVVASKPPPHRVTMNYNLLAAARHLFVLASGQGKRDALRNSLSSPESTPLGRVLASRNHSTVFHDFDL